jgi:hypothetical protein
MFAGHDPRLVLADVREQRHPGRVADRPDAVGDTAALIDRNPVLSDGDANAFEADACCPRPPPRGDDQHRAAQLAAVIELDDALAAFDAHASGLAAERQRDPVGLELLADQPADLHVFAVQ